MDIQIRGHIYSREKHGEISQRVRDLALGAVIGSILDPIEWRRQTARHNGLHSA